MSVKKMGSKLAQGVRQVMEQGKAPEVAGQETDHRPAAETTDSVSKPAPAKVTSKTVASSSDAKYEVLHPERIWPD
jgi:uncharacterized Zn-binding protein involved in type VI secretion